MAPAQASSGVSSLVASIKQHKKFRQLASYSVQCLCKVITPPHVGWERNLKDAYDAGALEAITDVLQRHHGDEDVLTASTACLSAMATNPKYAAALIESGALMGMLESVVTNPDQKNGVKESLLLLETIASNNPEALLSGGGVDAANLLIRSAPANRLIIGTAIRTLEKLNKVPGGSAALIAADSVKIVIQIIQEGNVDIEIIESSFRLLERMCRIAEHAIYIRTECDGLQILSAALENYTDSRVTMIGGRLLSKLASGNMSDLVARISRPSTVQEKEFLAGLLANLCLEDENAEKVYHAGGLSALLSVFEGGSKKAIDAAARALGRIAAGDVAGEEFIRMGAVTHLVKQMEVNRNDAQLTATITDTIHRLTNTVDRVPKVARAGGIEAVMRTLTLHPEFELHSSRALAFLDDLAALDYDVAKLADMGIIPGITTALKKHVGSHDVALAGVRGLIFFSGTEVNVRTMLTAGAFERAVELLSSPKKDTVIASLYLITSLLQLPEARDKLKGKTQEALLHALAKYCSDPLIRETAEELLGLFLTEDAVVVAVADFQLALEDLLGNKTNKVIAAKLKGLAQTLAAYSSASDFAEVVINAEGLHHIVKAIEKLSQYPVVPELDQILATAANVLTGLSMSVAESEELRGVLSSSSGVKAVVSAVKAQPKLKTHIAASVQFLDTFGSTLSLSDKLAEEGGVEACVAALRANGQDEDIVQAAFRALLTIASSDKGSLAVAKHGGIRQVISTISSLPSGKASGDITSQALALFQRVSLTSEGADLLIKQGGVDAVIQAARGTKDQSAVARILARILNQDDVVSVVEDLVELGASAKRGRLPAADVSHPVLSKVAHMAQIKNFAELVVKNEGAVALSQIVQLILSKDDEAPKAETLPFCFQAISSISKSVALPDSLGFAGFISQAIEGQYALAECLNCIGSVASSTENAAITLLNDGKTLNMVVSTLKDNIRVASVSTACFDAISSLAGHDSTAPYVASTDALRLAQDWVDDYVDDADHGAIASTLNALAAMARSPQHAQELLNQNIVELAKNVITKQCVDGQTPAPTVLRACIQLILRLTGTADGLSKIVASGVLRRITRAALTDPAYVRSAETTTSLTALFTDIANRGHVNELLAVGAQEVIIASMNANATSEEVVKSGAATLKALGASEDLVKAALEEVRTQSTQLETAAEITEEMVNTLGDSVQRLGNLMMMEGVVNASNAPQIMSAISNAVQLMAESEVASHNSLASAVSSVGRLVGIGGTSVESSIKHAVEMTLDVLELVSDSSAVRTAAVHTLGLLSASDAGLNAITGSGAIDRITSLAKSYAADQKLQDVTQRAISTITKETGKVASKLLVAGDAGAATLAAVVNANASNSANLSNVLAQVATLTGGDEAIYDVIVRPTTSNEVLVEALRVLRERSDESRNRFEGNTRRIAGLSKALQSVMALQVSLTANSDQRTKLQALRMAENTLTLLSRANFTANGAKELFAVNGVDSLLQLLAANLEDEETVVQTASILANVSRFANESFATSVVDPNNMAAIIDTLTVFPDNGPIVADILEVLAASVKLIGPAAAGIDREIFALIKDAADQSAAEPRVRAPFDSIQSAVNSRFSEADKAAKAVSQSLMAATQSLASVSTIQELKTEDGKTYYYNSATNETTWEAPAAYASFKAALAAASKAAEAHVTPLPVSTASASTATAAAAAVPTVTVAAVDASTVASMVQSLSTHLKSPEIISSVGQTLASLAQSEENAAEIANAGGIRAITAAIKASPDHVDMVLHLLTLMERISRIDNYKEQIVNGDGLDMVLNIALVKHLGNEDAVLKSLTILANLAFNSEFCITAILNLNAIVRIEAVLQKYASHPRVLENAMCTLSNLMFGSDENKLTIGQTVGDEVTNIIRDHPNDAALIKMALRALGNLSFCDENIRFIVEEHHATKAIVAAMRVHAKDADLQQLAMEVIGNFASLEEDSPEVDADGKETDPKDSIQSIILREAGCAQLIANIRFFSTNSAVICAGLDALANIANDVEVTEVMTDRQHLVEMVTETIQARDWDIEVVSRAVTLLAVMTYSKNVQPVIAQLDGVQVLLNACELHGSSPEVLASAQLALTNLAAAEETRTAIRNMEGVQTMLSLLEQHLDLKEYVTEVFKTLTRLCADDALSQSIAQQGMHILISAIDRYLNDPDFLTIAFRLLGHLAFVESNLTIIVQHNGIQKVIQAITLHPDSQPLMVRCIQTLDNVAMANKENAAIVIDEGGKELIETIMETFPESSDIEKAGSSALLSLSALENLSKSAEITAKAAKFGALKKKNVVENLPKDPLQEYRSLLKAGKVLKVWNKGSSTPAHVLMSPDFKSIVWQEISPPQKKLGAVDLRIVTGIREGTSEGHKKKLLGGKAVDPDCAFTVLLDRGSLDLEATTPKDMRTWVAALNLLFKVFRENPAAL